MWRMASIAMCVLLTCTAGESQFDPDRYIRSIPACALVQAATVAVATHQSVPTAGVEPPAEHGPGASGAETTSCRWDVETTRMAYWVNVHVVRFRARLRKAAGMEPASGAERAQFMLTSYETDTPAPPAGPLGFEKVVLESDSNRARLFAVDGNVFVMLEYGATNTQVVLRQEQEPIIQTAAAETLLEQAGMALRNYRADRSR